jgi:hypothetical protein
VASGLNIVDISGAEALAREAIYFCFMKDAVRQTLDKGGYLKTIGVTLS